MPEIRRHRIGNISVLFSMNGAVHEAKTFVWVISLPIILFSVAIAHADTPYEAARNSQVSTPSARATTPNFSAGPRLSAISPTAASETADYIVFPCGSQYCVRDGKNGVPLLDNPSCACEPGSCSGGSPYATADQAFAMAICNLRLTSGIEYTGKGKIYIASGRYVVGTSLNLDGTAGITLEGASSPVASAATVITSSGIAPLVSARRADGLTLRRLGLTYEGSSAADVVDFTQATSGIVEDVYLQAPVWANSAINLESAVHMSVSHSFIRGGQYGILGKAAGEITNSCSDVTYYSIATNIKSSEFASSAVAAIANAGQKWLIEGNIFEALSNGSAGAYTVLNNSQGACATAFINNWMGDVTPTSGSSTWINWSGEGLVITGNYIGGNGQARTTGISVSPDSLGISIMGNMFDYVATTFVIPPTTSQVFVAANVIDHSGDIPDGTGMVGVGSMTGGYFRATRPDGRALYVDGPLALALPGNGRAPVCFNDQFGVQVLASCGSSLRYKTDVRPLLGGLDIVNRLRPIAFRWKQGGAHDIGLAAEDVDQVEPLLTFRNATGEIEGVKYNQLSAVFVNAFGEQQAQIRRQEEQISEAQERLSAQQHELAALKTLICRSQPDADLCR